MTGRTGFAAVVIWSNPNTRDPPGMAPPSMSAAAPRVKPCNASSAGRSPLCGENICAARAALNPRSGASLEARSSPETVINGENALRRASSAGIASAEAGEPAGATGAA